MMNLPSTDSYTSLELLSNEIWDFHGRKIDNLRISVTAKCNLSCPYCHKEGYSESKAHEITLEEIKKIAKLFAELGVKSVKITGGEPLLREDIVEIIKVFKKEHYKDISLVTNGILLDKHVVKLKKAGLCRINIGCDSYFPILPKNVENIKHSILLAKDIGLTVKINMVLLRGLNIKELPYMIKFCKENGLNLQLIELIQNENSKFFEKHYFPISKIEPLLKNMAKRIEIRKMHGRKRYYITDKNFIEVVQPHSINFCKNCRRIRVTHDCKLKFCLRTSDSVNLRDILNSNWWVLKKKILMYIWQRKTYLDYALKNNQSMMNSA